MPSISPSKPKTSCIGRVALPWHEDDVATLFRMRGKGMPWNAIARFLKRTPEACKRRYELTHAEPVAAAHGR